MEDHEKDIRRYLKHAYKIHAPREELRDIFLREGYSPDVVERYLSEYYDKHHSHDFIFGLAILALIIAGILFLLFMPPWEQSCKTEECFIARAQACRQASLERFEGSSIFTYTTNDCTLTKTLTKVDPAESARVRQLLQGRSMVCAYQKNNFNTAWMDTLSVGLESCEGELKKGIQTILQV